nr:catalase-peroxidase [Acidobacteriota bacterium]
VLKTLEKIQTEFNAGHGQAAVEEKRSKKVSLADLIVLGGCAALEEAIKAANDGGFDVQVPFTPGRTDASQEQTDVESFTALEPDADGFRNYIGPGHDVPAERLLVERAFRLTLSAPEMTVLVGGLRALNVTAGQKGHGVFTDKPGTLTNDYFVNLIDMSTEWKPTSDANDEFEGKCLVKGHRKWSASRVDLVFGSNSELRALAEVYACDDAKRKFVRDFVKAWNKVMNLDRYDVAPGAGPAAVSSSASA